MEHGGGSGGGGGGAAPTGCFKCGRPGHWSRDCPSNPNSNSDDLNNASKSKPYASKTGGVSVAKSIEKPKKVPRSRPRFTTESLLSNDGIGYILRHFPRAFKYHGRGHEVRDLGNLLGLYAEWHSHLLPYYPFDQFVHKVEQVGASKRVKLCMKELQDKVASGGDPTKLHDDPIQHDNLNHEQEATPMNTEERSLFQEDNTLQNHDTDDFQEAMLHEIYAKATEEASQGLNNEAVASDVSGQKEISNQAAVNIGRCSAEIEISEEQKARIEANRLKALERAAARAGSSSQAA